MTTLSPRLSIECNLFRKIFDSLADQMREQIATDLARALARFRVPGGGQPDRQFRLYRPRHDLDRHRLSVRRGERHRFSAPEPADGFQFPEHDVFASGVVLWGEDEIVDLPS